MGRIGFGSCCAGAWKNGGGAALNPVGDCRRHSAAKPRISNDRRSGERRSARLKCRTLRRYKNEIEITEMLDCSRGERNRQKRRIRQVGRRGEMDSTADRAKVVCLIRGMLRRILLRRGRLGRRRAGDDGAACQLFEMDVSKRKDKLQRHRCKREPSVPPSISTNPTHWQNAPAPDWNSLQWSRSRAIPSLQGTVRIVARM